MTEASSSHPSPSFSRWYFVRRAAAAVIDYGIFIAFFFAYVSRFGTETSDGYQVSGCGHLSVLMVVWIAWLPLPEALFGKTLGKWGLDLRVVAADGRRPRASHFFLRRFFDAIDLFGFFGLVGYIVAKTNPRRQRVGDLVAKTCVIDESIETT